MKWSSFRKYALDLSQNLLKQSQTDDFNELLKLEGNIPTILESFELLGIGRNRIVFANPKKRWVYKFPISDSGITDNCNEVRYYSKYKTGKMAHCRLITLSGVPITVMEYIQIDLSESSLEKLPDWSEWVDCQQVGLNRKNQWKAYDYAGGAV